MNSRLTIAVMLLGCIFLARAIPVDQKPAEKEVVAPPAVAVENVAGEAEAPAVNADAKQPEDEKLFLPLFQLTAAIKPPAPAPAPPAPATQTLIIPQGTEVAVNTNQPITVQQQGTTIISQG